jgi:hypothetical protein
LIVAAFVASDILKLLGVAGFDVSVAGSGFGTFYFL